MYRTELAFQYMDDEARHYMAVHNFLDYNHVDNHTVFTYLVSTLSAQIKFFSQFSPVAAGRFYVPEESHAFFDLLCQHMTKQEFAAFWQDFYFICFCCADEVYWRDDFLSFFAFMKSRHTAQGNLFDIHFSYLGFNAETQRNPHPRFSPDQSVFTENALDFLVYQNRKMDIETAWVISVLADAQICRKAFILATINLRDQILGGTSHKSPILLWEHFGKLPNDLYQSLRVLMSEVCGSAAVEQYDFFVKYTQAGFTGFYQIANMSSQLSATMRYFDNHPKLFGDSCVVHFVNKMYSNLPKNTRSKAVGADWLLATCRLLNQPLSFYELLLLRDMIKNRSEMFLVDYHSMYRLCNMLYNTPHDAETTESRWRVALRSIWVDITDQIDHKPDTLPTNRALFYLYAQDILTDQYVKMHFPHGWVGPLWFQRDGSFMYKHLAWEWCCWGSVSLHWIAYIEQIEPRNRQQFFEYLSRIALPITQSKTDSFVNTLATQLSDRTHRLPPKALHE